MREILFRGKRVDNGEWVEGNYYKIPAPPVCFKEDLKTVRDKPYIILENPNSCPDWGMPRQMVQVEIIPETVGQYTGLKDKNGKKIFEGDIIKEWSHWHKNLSATVPDIECYLVVCDYLGSLYLKKNISCGEVSTPLIRTSIVEVIGNIHDNPELLEVEE